jgi:hypothetical protein
VGYVVFAFNADEQAQPGITAEFVEAGFDGRVSQGDAQQQNAPEDLDGITIVAAVAAAAKVVEEFGIGDGGEEVADGGEAGGLFEFVPGEERFGGVDAQRSTPGKKGFPKETRNSSPRNRRCGRKIAKKSFRAARRRDVLTNAGGRRFRVRANGP